MARSVQEILTDLLAIKTADTTLDVLTNPSNVSLWYNLIGAFAVETNIFEELMDALMIDINARALEIPVGTLKWYQAETLKYQYGDSLTVTNGIPVYDVIDETKQIVDVSAAIEQSGAVIIKAAKLNISGFPEPLSVAELSGLQGYWTQKRFTGAFLTVISQDGDLMKVYATIEVDGSKISSTGQSQSETGVYPVENAILEYFRLLGFNGRFTVSNLMAAIIAVDGVGAVVINEIYAKEDGAGTYTNVMRNELQEYSPVSGYIVEDDTDVMRDTITYIVS
jgi:hypothetical protein